MHLLKDVHLLNIEEIIERALGGEESAIESLLVQLKPLILYSIKRYGRIVGYDEDAYSDGVVVVLESLREFDRGKGVYFLGFVKVRLMHYYQNRKRKEKVIYSLDEPVDNEAEISKLDTIVDKHVDIPGDFIEKEEVIHIKDAISSLTKIQREIVIDYYYNHMSLVDIAIKRGVHRITIAKIKGTALKKLRKKLENIY